MRRGEMLEELVRGVFVVHPDGPPQYPYGNCMYVQDLRPAVIDMGAGACAFSAINCESVQLGLISHYHFDHLHGIDLFRQAGLYAGWQEQKAYSDEEQYVKLHGYELWEEMMPGVPRPPLGPVAPLPDDVMASPGFRKIILSGTFTDGELIDLGHRTLRAVYLPGHTVGHYGFYLEKEGILFSGDLDLVSSGPWYGSASADIGELIKSVKRIKDMDPKIIVPAHRRVQKQGIQSSLDRYIQVVLDRQDLILEILGKAMDLEELSHYPLGFKPAENIYGLFWKKISIRNHLRYLQCLGIIEEVEPGRYHRK